MTGKEELHIYCYFFTNQLGVSKQDIGFIEHLFGKQGTFQVKVI